MNPPDSLDGADVCVFIGVPEDVGYYAQMVVERSQSVIIALYDETLGVSEGAAHKFLNDLDKLSGSLSESRRHFAIMRTDAWESLYAMHSRETFGLCHFHADKRMRVPQSAKTIKHSSLIVDDLSSFSDIPNVQRQLQRIVDLLSDDPIAGMWPVSLLLGETGTGKSFAAAKIAGSSGMTVGRFLPRSFI